MHFFPTFFNAYELLGDTGRGEDDQFKFSVNAKSLLSPLRPKSANTIQSCTIQVGQSEDPTLAAARLAPGVDAGECRIIVRMNCQQGRAAVVLSRFFNFGAKASDWDPVSYSQEWSRRTD